MAFVTFRVRSTDFIFNFISLRDILVSANYFYIVTIRVYDKCCVVIGTVISTDTRSTIVFPARGECRIEKLLNFFFRLHFERNVYRSRCQCSVMNPEHSIVIGFSDMN